MKKGISTIISYQWIIALILSILLYSFISPKVDYYSAYNVYESNIGENYNVFFIDLESDGKPEEIQLIDSPINPIIRIENSTNSGLKTVVPLKGKWLRDKSLVKISLEDPNINNLFTIIQMNDSIYLAHIIVPKSYEMAKVDYIFLEKQNLFNRKDDIRVWITDVKDYNSDGNDDLLILFKAGYTKSPRRLTIYDIKNNNFIHSNNMGAAIASNNISYDINSDGKLEIFPATSGLNNYPKNTTVPFSDSISWFMVFDNQLNFLFEPIPYNLPTSKVSAMPFLYQNKVFCFASFRYHYSSEADTPPSVLIYNQKMDVIDSLILGLEEQKIAYRVLPLEETDYSSFLIEANFTNTIKKVFPDLTVKSIRNPLIGYKCKYLGTHEEGKQRAHVLLWETSETLAMIREDFKKVTYFNPKQPKTTFNKLTHPLSARNAKDLYFKMGSSVFQVTYSENPFYKFRYILLFPYFLIAFLLVFLVKQSILYQKSKKQLLQNEIQQNQLRAVLNQLDPHFAMNAFNSVYTAIQKNNSEKASEFIMTYSKFFRQVLISSDKITLTIREETELIKNYLKIEQLKYDHAFDYHIIQDIGINLETHIPRMCIFNHVENAVKHGMRNLEGRKGTINVSFKNHSDKNLFIEIVDNGIGRQKAKQQKNKGTGKGIFMAEEIFDLFYRLNGVRIKQEIIDLEDERRTAIGTKVIITVPLNWNG